jgi:hypothetical protein
MFLQVSSRYLTNTVAEILMFLVIDNFDHQVRSRFQIQEYKIIFFAAVLQILWWHTTIILGAV